MKQLAVDILFGRQHELAAPPAPAAAPIEVAPVYEFTLPLPTPVPLPSPTPFVCKPLSPQTPIDLPAPGTILSPPGPSTYTYRQQGMYSLGATKGTYPDKDIHGVLKATRGSDQVSGNYFDYVEGDLSGGSSYGFGFRLAPAHQATPGVLINGVQWRDAVRGNFDFIPAEPIQFIKTPLGAGATWQASGTDPINQSTVEVQGAYVGHDTVNACGTPLDSLQVHIDGNILSPVMQLAWSGDYDIGTQFGGLILAAKVTLSGPDRNKSLGDSYASTDTIVINTVPLRAVAR